MSRKIFIEGIQTTFGNALYEQLRDDHIDIHNYTHIYGSVSSTEQADSIKYFNYQQNQNLMLKTAMQCDIVILDLISPSEFTQIFLKYIKNIDLRKNIKIIALSIFATWAQTRKNIKYSTTDPLQVLKQNVYFQPFTQQDYSYRVPLHTYVYNHQLQALVLSLNRKQLITTTILCRGIMYGKDYSFELSSKFTNIFMKNKSLICYADGNNYLPMIHINDFCKMISLVCLNEISQPYLLAVDDSKTTQIALLNCLYQQLSLFEQKNIIFLNDYYKSNIFCCNIKFQRSKFLDTIEWQNKEGLVANKTRIIQQFNQFVSYQTKQIIIIGNNPVLKTEKQKQLKEQFGDRLIINQQIVDKFIQQVHEDKNKNQQLHTFILTNQNIDKKKLEQNSNYNIVFQKAVVILVQEQKYKGYIINISDNIIINIIDKISSPQMVIRCDQQLNKTQDLKASPAVVQNKNKVVLPPTSLQCLEGFTIINSNSTQYKKIFKNYIPDLEVQEQPLDIEQNKNEQNQSSCSQSSPKDSLQQKDQNSQIGTSLKQVNFKSRLSMMNQTNLFSFSMKQYIADCIMPAIIGGIQKIYQDQPDNIVEAFLQYLKYEGDKEKNEPLQKLTFKLKSQKVIPPISQKQIKENNEERNQTNIKYQTKQQEKVN